MAMIFKVITLVLFAGIFLSLGSALFYLVKDNKSSDRVIKALTWRIVLSLILFALLFVGFALGWIQPHSLL